MTKQQLKEHCEAEFENIDAVIYELNLIYKADKSDYSIAECAAIATFIHNCYNGVENILKRILSYQQIALKESASWHKDLLKISFEREIITQDLYFIFSNYMSFRHFFVHAYSFALKWDQLKPLVQDLQKSINEFESAINSFFEQMD